MDIAKLRRMADQIATNFAAAGHDSAVANTAEHIWKFWDPRMKAGIYGDSLEGMTPIAREAIEKLKADAAAA